MTFDSTPSADLASATEHAPRRQLHPDDGWRAWTEAEIAILRVAGDDFVSSGPGALGK